MAYRIFLHDLLKYFHVLSSPLSLWPLPLHVVTMATKMIDSYVPRLDTYSSVSTNEDHLVSDRDVSMEIPGYSSPSEHRDSIEESIPMQALRRSGDSGPVAGREPGRPEGPLAGERTIRKGPFVYREYVLANI